VLDDLGLVAALRWYVDRQAQLCGANLRRSGTLFHPQGRGKK